MTRAHKLYALKTIVYKEIFVLYWESGAKERSIFPVSSFLPSIFYSYAVFILVRFIPSGNLK